jgi:hypothetical protein
LVKSEQIGKPVQKVIKQIRSMKEYLAALEELVAMSPKDLKRGTKDADRTRLLVTAITEFEVDHLGDAIVGIRVKDPKLGSFILLNGYDLETRGEPFVDFENLRDLLDHHIVNETQRLLILRHGESGWHEFDFLEPIRAD